MANQRVRTRRAAQPASAEAASAAAALPPHERPRPAIRKPPILFRETQRVIRRIEREVGLPFIAYWNSDNGSVCENDVIGLYGVLRRLGARPHIMLFIKSDGGSGQSALT